jgi:cell division protein FtsB
VLLVNSARTDAVDSEEMNVNLGIWDKLSKAIVFLLFVAGLLAVFLKYLPLIEQNQRFRRRLIDLEAQYAAEEKAARQLRQSSDALQNDPKTVERLAREKLGWSKTNEMVVHFEPPAPPRR